MSKTETKPEAKAPELKKEQTLIKHVFSDAERSDLGQALASAVAEAARLEAERKSINTDYKAKIQEKEALITGLSGRVSSGFEMRPTMCIVLIDRLAGLKRYFPNDVDRDDLANAVPLKDEPLPPGYQVEIDDVIVEKSSNGAVDISIEDHLENEIGEDLSDEVVERELSLKEEPNKQNRELWVVWLRHFLFEVAELYKLDPFETVPHVSFLSEYKQPALNRLRAWMITHIQAAEKGATDPGDKSYKLPGFPSILDDWKAELKK